jgi:hypothetical protein
MSQSPLLPRAVRLRRGLAVVSVSLLGGVGLLATGVASAAPAPATITSTPAPVAAASTVRAAQVTATDDGYWEVASDGGIFSFGGATFYGSEGATHLNAPIVGIAATPDGRGYWEVASDGGVFTFGDAGFYGSEGATHLNAPIVGIAATPDGRGYWEVASDGGIFNFGDAGFYGSEGGTHLNAPVVGIAATADGRGYWEVASDGGIFNFGDAGFHGSEGGAHLNKPIVGIAASPDGGYWMDASDGGIFNFGGAGYFGSQGSTPLNEPVVGMAPTLDGQGYWMDASDGGIFAHGDAAFAGSEGGSPLNAPIVGMAPAAGAGLDVDPGHSITGISCPTATFCMAVDDAGNAISYANGTWSAPQVVDTGAAHGDPGEGAFDGVACPTTTFCLAVSYLDGAATYSDGVWSATAFPAGIPNPDFSGVSCLVADDCYVSDLHGDGSYTDHSGSWQTDSFPVTSGTMQGSTPVSCSGPISSTPICMFVDSDNDYSVEAEGPFIQVENADIDPAAGAAGAFDLGVSCTGRDFCVAAHSSLGYAEVWNGSTWSSDGNIDPVSDSGIEGVGCAATTCAAVDFEGNVVYTANGSTWTAPAPFTNQAGGGVPSVVSCGSPTFCVAGDSNGYVYPLTPTV